MAILPELETSRLSLRRLTFDDAPFLVALYNEPSFRENIGDRGVHGIEDAHRFLRDGPMTMYERFGYGLWHVSRKQDGAGIGTCGLLRRDTLPDTALGYAFFPAYWGQGYAFEAAEATLRHVSRKFGLRRVIAVVSPANGASIRVLEKSGLRFEGLHTDPTEPGLRLYARDLSGA